MKLKIKLRGNELISIDINSIMLMAMRWECDNFDDNDVIIAISGNSNDYFKFIGLMKQLESDYDIKLLSSETTINLKRVIDKLEETNDTLDKVKTTSPMHINVTRLLNLSRLGLIDVVIME